MVRSLLVLLVVLGALAPDARAAPGERLLLIEVPGSVEAALRTSLAPWGVEVVAVEPAPAAFAPDTLAAERGAAYVAWRRGGDLVLYDAALATEQRRPLSSDVSDAEAAAVALSIKTWMGLGPPPGDVCGLDDCSRSTAPRPRHRWLVELSTGVRADPAHQGGAGFRYGLAAGHRRGRFEAGLRVDLGVDNQGQAFGRTGMWSVVSGGAWGRMG